MDAVYKYEYSYWVIVLVVALACIERRSVEEKDIVDGALPALVAMWEVENVG